MKKSNISTKDEVWDLMKEMQKNVLNMHKAQDRIQASKEEDKKRIREIGEQMKETREQMKETDERMKKTDIRINAIVGDFGNRWGKLSENLVKGGLVQRLKERGIEVEKFIANLKHDDTEFDIIAINGKEAVVLEMKAILDPSDVDEFEEDISRFKTLWPEFKDKTIYGALGFLMKASRQANEMAQKRGFFVIEATGDVIIQNKKNFAPKVFS